MTNKGVVDEQALQSLFLVKYGSPLAVGWGPRQRLRFDYYTPDDMYEATVASYVEPGCFWLDVGCGRDIFPNNKVLARDLAARCGWLVGVDPSDNIDDNKLLHERAKTTIDQYETIRQFDLITLRMVAEHVTNPKMTVQSLARLLKPGGHLIIYTVNKWSPVSILSAVIPFRLHHRVKATVWQTEEQDTFPVAYLMNTRTQLRKLFSGSGFREASFQYLDDCRASCRFRTLNMVELSVRWLCRKVNIPYPENCLLCIHERVNEAATSGEANGPAQHGHCI
jgi:SAM-dependent methyltransferase